MYRTIITSIAVAVLSSAAFAGTCTDSERKASQRKVDVNIKVKNDTAETIIVSIWKGSETEKKTVFADEAIVHSDGKEGKTDKNVTDAYYYFSAKRVDTDTEAVCAFNAYTTEQEGFMAGGVEFTTDVSYFECLSRGGFKISCEKSFNSSKDRWNVKYSLE